LASETILLLSEFMTTFDDALLGQLYGLRHLLGDLCREVRRLLKPVDYYGRVDALLQELLGSRQKPPSQDDHRGGAVADLGVLGLGDLYEQLGRRMLYLHLLQYRRAIAGYGHVAEGVDQHFVHAAGAKRRGEYLRDNLSGLDVGAPGVLAGGALRPLLQDHYRYSSSLWSLCHGLT
jgi:hypothetical protein